MLHQEVDRRQEIVRDLADRTNHLEARHEQVPHVGHRVRGTPYIRCEDARLSPPVQTSGMGS
jgi:hypothetical protein